MNKLAFRKIHDLVAEDDLADAIQLLLKEMPKNKIDEAILHSARFKDLQRHIRLGLIDYKEQSLTKSQIRYGILESVKAIEGEFQVSVLVAGTGRYNLPVDVYLMAKSIGKKLGEEGAKLVCGGWEGVDYVVDEVVSNKVVDLIKKIKP